MAPRPVPPGLLKERKEVVCLKPKPDYGVDEVEDAVSCERDEKEGARDQLRALQSAVRSREAIAKRAVAASKK